MAAIDDTMTLLAMARAFAALLRDEADAAGTGAEEVVRLSVKNAGVLVSDPGVEKNLWVSEERLLVRQGR